MRVTAGTAKGVVLSTKGCGKARPTTDSARSALFDSLGVRVKGVFFVDWCAGTGSVGLEALSRGAEKALFIEVHSACVRTLEANCTKAKLREQAEIWRCDIRIGARRMARRGLKADILFADPPYRPGFLDLVKTLACKYEVVRPGGLLILQGAEQTEVEPPAGFAPVRVLKSAGGWFSLFERESLV